MPKRFDQILQRLQKKKLRKKYFNGFNPLGDQLGGIYFLSFFFFFFFKFLKKNYKKKNEIDIVYVKSFS